MELVLTPKQTKKFKKDIIKELKRCKTSSELNFAIGIIYQAGETQSN